jgi:hypothetical protein
MLYKRDIWASNFPVGLISDSIDIPDRHKNETGKLRPQKSSNSLSILGETEA